jgi:short-subunit dehydrogenase
MSGKLKNILITGTSSGIWNALKNNFEQNFNIIWVSRTGENDINIDLSDTQNLEKIIHYVQENNIILDSIILNAGIWFFDEFENISQQDHEQILDLNLKSPILLTQKLLPFLEEKARIIFIGSVCSKKFMKYGAVYQASKFGIRGFAGSLKNELKWKKIHLINPKIVETNFHNHSKIPMDSHKQTHMSDIITTVENIFSWEETRFEIDL